MANGSATCEERHTGAAARKRAAGVAYVAVLLALALLALVAVSAARLGAASHRQAAETALLEAGAAWSSALGSYARATPKGQPDAPRTLNDLLRDPRFPGVVRHLRSVPVDPLTGQQSWGLVREDNSEDGGIVGIYSLARGRPLKQANFDSRFTDFARRQSYAEWLFVPPPDPSATGLRSGLVEAGVLRMQERMGSKPAAPWSPWDSGEPDVERRGD